MNKKRIKKILEIISGVLVILLFLGVFVTIFLASNGVVSAGIPITIFGFLFVYIPIVGKSVEKSFRDIISGNIIIISVGVGIMAIGLSILFKNPMVFIYSFLNIFLISGLSIIISIIYTYIYNKKYCTKKVSAVCTEIIVGLTNISIFGKHYGTTSPIFNILNEDGTKGKELISDISSNRVFIIGETYELMVNPKNNYDFYVLGDNLFLANIIPIVISSIFIIFTIIGDIVLLSSNFFID